MSVKGLGNDIIEIARVKEGISKHGQRFLDRLFTPKEQEYCGAHASPESNYAGRFAAKEAITKALGCGIGAKISWLDIEILSNSEGQPQVHFSGGLKEQFNDPKILLSISHCKTHATAVAIWI